MRSASETSPAAVEAAGPWTDWAVRVENISVTYRASVDKRPTFKKTLVRLGRRERTVREIQRASRRLLRGPARDRAGHHRHERRRQVDVDANGCGHTPAKPRQGRGPRTREHAARARRRFQQRSERARECHPRRARRRAHPGAGGGEVRRDRGVLGARRLHRPADANLLVRDVRSAGLLGRRQHGAGHPPHRRGAFGRRRTLQAEVVREDARALRRRAVRSSSSPTG